MSTYKDDLVESFDDWFETILAILAKPKPKQPVGENTGLVSGYNLNGLDQIVKDALAAHMSVTNEHSLTLKQLNALSNQEIFDLLFNYQNSYNIPLTMIPNLGPKVSMDWPTRKLTVTNPGKIVFLGKEATLPNMTVTLPNVVNQVVTLVVTGTYSARTFSLEGAADPTINMNRVPFLRVDLAGKIVSGRVVTRIGMHELSSTKVGTGIPVSEGNQSRSGAIATPWYGG